jgi:calcineurin-like phosphoesterase
VATGDPRLNGVIIAADETTGRAQSIERLSLTLKDIEVLASELAAHEKT